MTDHASPNGIGCNHGGGTLHLLNRDMPEDYRREWTERIAARKERSAPGNESGLVFRIGSEWLALPTRVFQEVAEQCVVHTIPHRRADVVAGIVNIRGELLLCALLDAVLGIRETCAPAPGKQPRLFERLLVTRADQYRLAFPVHEIGGVVRYDRTELRPAPATLTHGCLPFTLGLLPWEERTVGCLDAERLFHKLEESFR